MMIFLSLRFYPVLTINGSKNQSKVRKNLFVDNTDY